MTTAAPALTMIPATFSRAEVAEIIGIPETRVRDWGKAPKCTITPTSYDYDKSARYSRDALVLGTLLVILQEVFGIASRVPMIVIERVKAVGVTSYADAIRDDATVEPVAIGIVENGVEAKITICDDQICRRLRQRIIERVVPRR